MSLAEDRKGVSSLHGLSNVKSNTDASGSPELSKSVKSITPDPSDRKVYWKHSPTIISPGIAQKSQNTMTKTYKPGDNPYSYTNNTRGGNTKSQVLVGGNSKADGPRKNRKLENGGSASSSSAATSKYFMNENGNAVRSRKSINLNSTFSSFSNSKSTDATIVPSSPLSSPPREDFDIPISYTSLERSSEDPLDLIKIDQEDIHPFRQQDTPRRISAGAPDGPSTQRLRAKINEDNASNVLSSTSNVINVDADDSIEDADSFLPKNDDSVQPQFRALTPNGQTHFKLNSVHESVVKINNQQGTTIPFLDLRKKSRVNGMKRKGKANDHTPKLGRAPPPLQMRDATTSSTNYKNASNDIWLPISLWALDSTKHPTNEKSHYFLRWNEDHPMVAVTQERSENDNYKVCHELPFSMIISGKWCKNESDPFLQIDANISSESPYRRCFTFGFDSRGYDKQNYHRLLTFLKRHSTIDCLDQFGVKAAWDMIERDTLCTPEINRQIVDQCNSISSHINSVKAYNMETYTKQPMSRPRPRPAKREESLSPVLQSQALRRSSRQASGQNHTSINNDEIILVYPPSGSGAVNICGSDLRRLQPGEFLNDTLIELGLKFWLNDLRQTNPDLAEDIHVFNSFFYKKLNVKNINEGYQSIRKWTMKFDIFKKKYIIVPINEHMHWYLSIICFPEHVLRPPPPKVVKVSTRAGKRKFGDDFTTEEVPQILSTTSPDVSPPSSEQTTSSRDAVELIIKPTGKCSITDEESNDPTTLMDVDEDSKSRKSTDTDNFEQLTWGGMEGGGPASQTIVPDSESDSNEEQIDQLIDDDVTDGSVSLNEPQSVLDCPAETTTDIQSNGGMEGSSSTSLDKQMDVENSSTSPLLLDDSEILNQSSSRREHQHTDSGSLSAVTPTQFYTSKVRSDSKAATFQSNIFRAPEDDDVADDETIADDMSFSDEASTYVFTLDSLGSRHPQAIKVLRTFLQLEAKDKKSLEETSAAVGKMASVPTQPNYCDCGLYLLHFVRVFMSDPEKVIKSICSQSTKNATENNLRRRLWKAEEVDSLRVDMATRILRESETWKKEKAKKSAGALGNSAGGAADKNNNVSPADSDEDIIIQGAVIKASVKGGRGRRSTESKAESEERTGLQSASRLRG